MSTIHISHFYFYFFILFSEARPSGRENRRPSDLNVVPRHGGVMSNPALRSSAPDLLRPSHDESPSTSAEHRPGSPVSPFCVEDNETPTVNRRRNLPREMRPFSEFYSEEFVPLDPDISPARNITRDESSSIATAGVEPTEENDDNAETVVIENGADEPNEESNPSEAPRAAQNDDPVEDEAIAHDECAESLDSLDELLQSEGDEVEDDDDVTNRLETQVLEAVTSARSSRGSIELTEDSPLRILEESEQAMNEEATFTPPNMEDSDDMFEEGAEEGAYGFTNENPNDGDDEMDSERSTPDDDVSEMAVISVDSWTYEQNGSTNTHEAGPSGLSPPRYASNASDDIEDSERHSNISRSQDELSLAVEENEMLTDDTDSLIAAEGIEINDARQSPSAHIEYTESPTLSLPTEGLPLVDDSEHGSQDDIVNHGSSSSSASAERRNKTKDKNIRSPRTVVKHISKSESQTLDMSSVAFPMDEGEPDCMDFTSIQNSTSSQMVVDSPISPRSNRSESLIETRSNHSESLVGGKTARSMSLVDARSHNNESEMEVRPTRNKSPVDARTEHSESPVNRRSNKSESTNTRRSNRARYNRSESLTDDRPNHSDSSVTHTRLDRSLSLVDSRLNESGSSRIESNSVESRSNQAVIDSRKNGTGSSHVGSNEVDPRSNRSHSMVESRSNGYNQVQSNSLDSRSSRRQAAIVSFSRSDDHRSSTRSEGQVAFIESVPVRPARRSKQLARSVSDTRSTRLAHRPERPERQRRKRTETEPRASVRYEMSEPFHRASLSDPVVVAVPLSSDSARSHYDTSQEATFIAVAGSSASVTPIPSPTIDSDHSSPRGRDLNEVVALPIASTKNDSETRAVLAAVSSPRETTTVTPIPSPTGERPSMTRLDDFDGQADETQELPSSPRPSSSSTPSTSQTPTNAERIQPGATTNQSSDLPLNRENISKMLRTYVRSAQTPQRPPHIDEPRYRREDDDAAATSTQHTRGRPPRHEVAEPSRGSSGLPTQDRGRPPSHESSTSSRRRSRQRQRESRSQHDRDGNPVHLQIQDGETRSRRATDNEPLPPSKIMLEFISVSMKIICLCLLLFVISF